MFTDKGKTEDEDVEKASSELFCDIAAHIQPSTLKTKMLANVCGGSQHVLVMGRCIISLETRMN